MNDYFFLGKITKPIGYKGDVNVWLDVDEPLNYDNLPSVFIKIKKDFIPYFFQKFEVRGANAIAHFEDLSAEEAQSLVGAELYLPLSVLPKLEGNKFYYHEVIGFTMIDVEKGNIGILDNVNDNGPQAIFQIKHSSGKEILVPIIDKFLVKVERENKNIHINAPEGLIDFYL
ncbi:MAG: ribosome maturation factor RimM [Bacteroidales bacterium]|jgi:16S rRNA processing protein RimM|nr:ribosome maturation factor RimM [Bacteroidales bacterium]